MTTDDRTLLERAARAAGIEVGGEDFADPIGRKYVDNLGLWVKVGGFDDMGRWFNPLHDDGEALRLAVKLQAAKGATWAICLSIGDDRTACEFHYACGPDPAANTRRAITCAAAEIGKARAAASGAAQGDDHA